MYNMARRLHTPHNSQIFISICIYKKKTMYLVCDLITIICKAHIVIFSYHTTYRLMNRDTHTRGTANDGRCTIAWIWTNKRTLRFDVYLLRVNKFYKNDNSYERWSYIISRNYHFNTNTILFCFKLKKLLFFFMRLFVVSVCDGLIEIRNRESIKSSSAHITT